MNRWRNQYSWVKWEDAKRLKGLERDNGRLKRVVADQALEISTGWQKNEAGLDGHP